MSNYLDTCKWINLPYLVSRAVCGWCWFGLHLGHGGESLLCGHRLLLFHQFSYLLLQSRWQPHILQDLETELKNSISNISDWSSKPKNVSSVSLSLTLTATWSFAVRLEGPEASKFFPSTSTAIVNTGTWTGPVWERSLYCRPGFSWFRRIRAFMACAGSAFSSGAEGQKTRCVYVQSSA